MWDRKSLAQALLGPPFEPPVRRSDAPQSFVSTAHVEGRQLGAGARERPHRTAYLWTARIARLLINAKPRHSSASGIGIR